MLESLSGIRTLTLDRRDLRRLAAELCTRTPTNARLNDRQVLRLLLDQVGKTKKITFDLKELSLEGLLADTAASCGVIVDLSLDLERGSDGQLRISDHFWRRIISKFAQQPWAFICNYAENDASAVHNDIHGISYGFHEDVTSWRGIVSAGPGSYVLFYNTVNAPSAQRHYTAIARVAEIEEVETDDASQRRAWRAHLEHFRTFSPVHFDAVHIEGRNSQHGIQAITWGTLLKVLELGQSEPPLIPTVDMPSKADLHLPTIEPSLSEVLTRGPERLAWHTDGQVVEERPLAPYRDSRDPETGRSIVRYARDPARDKLVEVNAVSIATAYLTALGWSVLNDRQKDGVGYDFEFLKEKQHLLVEVKGIGGDRLEFNMTAKEWHVCTSDELFVLIAVTNALDSDKYQIHVLTKKELSQFRRQATQFRLYRD